MVSFDVEALFPSIPIEAALSALKEHLTTTYFHLKINARVINILAQIVVAFFSFLFFTK